MQGFILCNYPHGACCLHMHSPEVNFRVNPLLKFNRQNDTEKGQLQCAVTNKTYISTHLTSATHFDLLLFSDKIQIIKTSFDIHAKYMQI